LSQMRRKRSLIGELPDYKEPDRKQEQKKFEEERNNTRRVRRRTNVLTLQSIGEPTYAKEVPANKKEKPRKSVCARIAEAEKSAATADVAPAAAAQQPAGNDGFGGQGPAAIICLEDSQPPTVPPAETMPSLEPASEVQPVDAPLDDNSTPVKAESKPVEVAAAAAAAAAPVAAVVDASSSPLLLLTPVKKEDEKRKVPAMPTPMHVLAEQKLKDEQQLVMLACRLQSVYQRQRDQGCVCQAGEVRDLILHISAVASVYKRRIRQGLLGEELE
jgi:hypothetical protein